MFDHYKYTKVEFDWEIRISEFVIESANGFHLREIRFQDGFQQRNPNPDVMDFFFTVPLGNPKKDLQNYSRKHGSSFC